MVSFAKPNQKQRRCHAITTSRNLVIQTRTLKFSNKIICPKNTSSTSKSICSSGEMVYFWLTSSLRHLLKTTFCNKLQARWRRQIVRDKADPGTLMANFQTTSTIRSPSKHFYSTLTLKSSVNSSGIIGPRISKVIFSKRLAKPLGSRGPGSRWGIYRRRPTWCSETHRRHNFNLQSRMAMIV